MSTPVALMKYLEKAMNRLDDLGLLPASKETSETPVIALLDQILNWMKVK